MNRQQKEAVVQAFRENLTGTKAAFLVGYRGLSVSQMQALRTDLREVGGLLKITKARLMNIAAQDIEGMDEFRGGFRDQVGLVFVKEEVPSVAKVLVEFSKENDALNVISAFFESRVLTKQRIKNLASLPSRDILLSMLVGTLQAPISGLARVLNQIVLKPMYALKQIAEKEK
jgi:large subunit ribosomal protein L10